MTHPLHLFKFCPKCGSPHFVENNEKSKRCEDCSFVYYFNPSASTVALIVNNDGELLVATRAKEPVKGTLDLPGGFVDLNETIEETVVREIKEEANLNVNRVEYLFSETNIYPYSGFDVHTVDFVFRCFVDDISPMKAADDVSKLEFIKIENLNPELFGLTSIQNIIRKIKTTKI